MCTYLRPNLSRQQSSHFFLLNPNTKHHERISIRQHPHAAALRRRHRRCITESATSTLKEHHRAIPNLSLYDLPTYFRFSIPIPLQGGERGKTPPRLASSKLRRVFSLLYIDRLARAIHIFPVNHDDGRYIVIFRLCWSCLARLPGSELRCSLTTDYRLVSAVPILFKVPVRFR